MLLTYISVFITFYWLILIVMLICLEIGEQMVQPDLWGGPDDTYWVWGGGGAMSFFLKKVCSVDTAKKSLLPHRQKQFKVYRKKVCSVTKMSKSPDPLENICINTISFYFVISMVRY